jgi:PAS domain S-box-containing protein
MNDALKVLLIEDNPGDARLIRETLMSEKAGLFHLESVDRLSAGLQKLSAQKIDVILLDLGLPDSQGFDTFLKVKILAPHIPVVILSGLNDEELAARAVREGAQDYLVKGKVDNNLLVRSLRYAIERKLAEKALISANKLLDETQVISKIGGWEYEVASARINWTKETYRIYGVDPDYDINDVSRDIGFYTADDRQRLETAFRRSIEIGEAYDLELKFRRANGEQIWVRTSGKPIIENGKVIRVTGTFIDITDHKLAEDRLKLHEIHLQNLLNLHRKANSAEQSIIDFMLEACTSSLQSQFALIGAISQAETVMTIHALSKQAMQTGDIPDKPFHCHVAEAGLWSEAVRQRKPVLVNAYASGQAITKGYPMDYVPIKRFLSVPVFSAGKIVAVAAVANKASEYDEADVNALTSLLNEMWNLIESKRTDEQLKKSRLLLMASLECQKNTILFSIDRNYRYLYFNKAHLDVMKFAYNTDIELGMNILDCISSEDDRQTAKQNYDRALMGESHFNVRIYGDLNLAYYESYFNPILNDHEIIGATGLARDITGRIKQEEDRLRIQEQFHLLVESAPDAIFIQTQGKFAYVNPSCLRLFGFEQADQLLGQPVISRFHPDFRELVGARINTLNDSRHAVPQIEEIILRLNGQSVDVEVSAVPFFYNNLNGALVFMRDISERKQTLAKTLELAALKRVDLAKSELLANVSHELRTPLASIKGFIETLIEPDVKWSKIQQLEFLQSANKEADRLTLLIKGLLDMSRIDSGKLTLDRQNSNLSEVLISAESILSNMTNKHCLKLNVPANLPNLYIDRIKIAQVITNLVENATKFSAEGSQILIEAVLNDDNIIISVSDNGIGMSPGVVASVFNRFYQAKQVVDGKTRGTGLGLSICKGIVEAHGGQIWVESQPGIGSKFSFTIPIVNPKNSDVSNRLLKDSRDNC